MKIARYWHTLRHLRPVQIYGRLWFRLARPRPDTSGPPPVREASGTWAAPARREPSLVAPGHFHLLEVEGLLSRIGWNGPQREKLWRYNQHYFDDLNAFGAAGRTEWQLALMKSWVAENPPGMGDGWEPYPVSLRIVNWVKWVLSGNALPPECVRSLAVQARWLRRRLEVHLQGNHLFSNAKALVFAGLFFQGNEARAWLHMGLRILREQIPEQILADGGHFERSTMYHALAFEDMLDLCNVAGCFPHVIPLADIDAPDGWRAKAASMRTWLAAMCHPDGEISFFNDAAAGVAPSPGELHAYADRLGVGSTDSTTGSRHLAASGYARLSCADALALLDLAPVGPDHLPGHAHADTLAFELTIGTQRFLVNSGTSCYGLGTERLRQRGTAAHNTVVVSGQDSSEVWSGFRVARRARVRAVSVGTGPDGLQARGTHDGYARLPGAPLHHRVWQLSPGEFVVADQLSAPSAPAQARFHFHPQVRMECGADGRGGLALLPDGDEVEWSVERGQAVLEPSTWHPRFGVSVPNVCLSVRLVDGRSTVRFRWRTGQK